MIETIYKYIINKHNVPIDFLYEIGLSETDINTLNNNHYLEKDNYYVTISTVDTFLDSLIFINRYDIAINFLDVLLKNNDDINNKQNYNYYYVLLSHLTSLNDIQKEYVSSLKYDDIKIINKENTYCFGNNNAIRRKVFKYRFEEAKKDEIELHNIYTNNNVKFNIIPGIMLNNIIKNEREKNEIIYVLIQNERYEELNLYLNYLKDNRILNRYEKVMLMLIDEIFSLNEGINNENRLLRGDNYIETITLKNYHLALSMGSSCEERVNHETDVVLINMLLSKIVKLIDLKPKKRVLK